MDRRKPQIWETMMQVNVFSETFLIETTKPSRLSEIIFVVSVFHLGIIRGLHSILLWQTYRLWKFNLVLNDQSAGNNNFEQHKWKYLHFTNSQQLPKFREGFVLVFFLYVLLCLSSFFHVRPRGVNTPSVQWADCTMPFLLKLLSNIVAWSTETNLKFLTSSIHIYSLQIIHIYKEGLRKGSILKFLPLTCIFFRSYPSSSFGQNYLKFKSKLGDSKHIFLIT